jgi:glutaredoxin
MRVGGLHGALCTAAGDYHWSPMPTVVMYSRRTCGLCDKARAVIEAQSGRTPFEFREVFIDGDDALELEYGLRVPVVEVDGKEEFEFHVDRERLAKLLGAGGARWEGTVR